MNFEGDVEEKLMTIFSEYQELAKWVEKFENPSYNLIDAYNIISNLTFDKDSCDVKSYIKARLES